MSSIDAVPDEVLRRLNESESVLWWGRPLPGVIIRAPDIVLTLFGVFWMVGVLVFYRDATAGETPVSLLLFGIPFALVGAYMAGGHFFFDRAKRERMLYAVTTHRIFIIEAGRFEFVRLADITELRLMEGAVDFEYSGRRKDIISRPDLVPDAKRVHDIIKLGTKRDDI